MLKYRAALISVLILMGGRLPLAAQTYTLTPFSVPYAPKHGTYALGINNRGAVVGYFSDINGPHPTRGFRRNADGIFEPPINDPDGASAQYPYTVPTGINNSGVIGGYYFNPSDLSTRGFLRDDGIFQDFYAHPGNDTYVLGINNKGDLVGRFVNSQGVYHGFATINGVTSFINFPVGQSTIPYGIAADGTIVGDFFLAKNSITCGFMRGPAGQYKAFLLPGTVSTIPYAINNAVHKIVGSYISSGSWNGVVHGFVYDYITGIVTTVDWQDSNASAVETFITGINSSGVIVGWVAEEDSQHHSPPAFSFIGTPH